jgi:hypothetical protein
MRRADDELARTGAARIFFHSPERPFRDPRDWGTLIHLLNEDHADLLAKRVVKAASAAELLLERIDAAGAKAGIPARLAGLGAAARKAVVTALEKEARDLLDEKHASYPDTLEGKTLVIEFARGGADGSAMPLAAPFGYGYSIGALSPAILERATILYIWVTPAESRRKNHARTDPNDPGSILHHGVPIEVMMKDYGCDDMDWLEQHAEKPGTLTIAAHGRKFHVPIARFDNRIDKTSFIREDKAKWSAADVKAVHDGLAGALTKLSGAYARK